MKKQNIHIRSLSPDSDHMIRRLITIFRKCYNHFYPVESVYDIHYWKTHIGRRLIPLVATNAQDEILAHIALCPDAKQPDHQETTHIQALYAVYDPALVDQETLTEIAHLFRTQIQELAKRQSWDMIYCFSPIISNITENIEDILLGQSGFHSTAHIPSYFRVPATQESDSDTFYDCTLSVSLANRAFSHSRQLHLPEQELQEMLTLAETLGLKRTPGMSMSMDYALQTDMTSIMTHSFRTIDVSHSFISPSLLHEPEVVARRLAQGALQRSQTLFLDIEDPNFTSCLDIFVRHGFRPSGFFPLAHGHDNIVLSRSIEDARADGNNLYSKFSGTHAEYTVHSTKSHSSDTHVNGIAPEVAHHQLHENEH